VGGGDRGAEEECYFPERRRVGKKEGVTHCLEEGNHQFQKGLTGGANALSLVSWALCWREDVRAWFHAEEWWTHGRTNPVRTDRGGDVLESNLLRAVQAFRKEYSRVTSWRVRDAGGKRDSYHTGGEGKIGISES